MSIDFIDRALIRRCLSGLLIGVLAVTLCSCRVAPGPKPLFRRDLRSFGYPTDGLGRIVGDFSDISFLSNDLVLVTINTTTFGDEGSSDFDQPESKLLLFDLSGSGAAPVTVAMPVRKAKDSVQSAGNGSFVLLNRAGVQVCSRALQCGPPVQTGGPMFLSPQGMRIAVGRREQKVLDGATLKELHEFGANEPKVIPGDTGLLYTQQGKLYVTLDDQAEPRFVLDSGSTGVWPEARFLDANTISAVQADKSVAIARLDGTVVSRVPLSPGSFVAEMSTSASGSRFSFHDAGYIGLNAFLNFFSIERPFNLERVRVVDVATGKTAFRLRWDPRPYVGILARPALSPDGHRLAIIRHGFLEVFAIR